LAAAEGPEFVVVHVRDGEIADAGSWVYAWLDRGADFAVVYVGATGLDPATRIWLHLHDPDPDIGRMAARFDRLATTDLDVLAMRVPDEISRADVRDVVGIRLEAEHLLSPDAIVDHLQPLVDPPPECVELAERFVARVRTYAEQEDAPLL
jgi:hypothetical protein